MKISEYASKHLSRKVRSDPWSGTKYRTVIDVETSSQNLLDVCEVFDEYDINYRVVFGTLLGIHRDGELIPHDVDVDIALRVEDMEKFVSTIKHINKKGLDVIRVSGNQLLSFGRNNDYIDIYFFTNRGDKYTLNTYELLKEDFNCNNTIEFRGVKLKTVKNIEGFLIKHYGSDWNIPIKGISASCKHNNKKMQKNK